MKMIKPFLVIFICIGDFENALGSFSETSDYDDVHHDRRFTLFPSKIPLSQGNEEVDEHQQIYVGFANNPFGASKMQDNPKLNISSVSFPKRINTTRNNTRKKVTSEESRSKRGVVHLYNMVSCATGCDPLIYKGYGCYCGFLGSGYVIDGIDRCCKMHDWCYDTTRCPVFLEYFMPYYWICYNNKPICAVIHGEYGGRRSCAGQLCECDRKLSECLSRFPCPRSRALCRSSPLRLLQNTFMII